MTYTHLVCINMNENHSKSNLWTGVALVAGILTLGIGLAEYESLVNSIGDLNQEDQIKGMLNAGERLGQILTPENTARTTDLITVGKEMMDSIHTLGMLVGTWVSQFIHSGSVSMSNIVS